MERVAFLIEQTGQRLPCLLNPRSVVQRRLAGVRARRSVGGALTGAGLSDDPLLYTGGGTTELRLDLLFDVSIPGASSATEDVRDLTAPLWNLAENARVEEGRGRPSLVRFVWGKAWNIPGVVTAVAERLEDFTAGGFPRRSWLRMRLLRAPEPSAPGRAPGSLSGLGEAALAGGEVAADQVRVHEVVGETPGEATGAAASDRLDEVAYRYYGDPSLWRLVAAFNGLLDPMRIRPGFQLQLPPLPRATESR